MGWKGWNVWNHQDSSPVLALEYWGKKDQWRQTLHNE
jgi:hypothetical protein